MATARQLEAGVLRAYRGCLALYPAEFREEYGRELCLVFADRWRAERSLAGRAMVWMESLHGILREAPKEHLHLIAHDLRYALRVLRKDIGLTVAALTILALGIGATTLVFSLANGLLLRPLPYANPDRLVAVDEYDPKADSRIGEMSFPNSADLAARARLTENLGVYDEVLAVLRGAGEAESVNAAEVSDGVFRALGVQPMLGRIFSREEASPGGPRTVILSEALWARRYGRDPNIVGSSIGFGSGNRIVVGVMPPSFHFPERAELWVALRNDPASSSRTDYYLRAVARLKPGVSTAQASAEMETMLEQIHRQYPAANNDWRARVTPLRTYEATSYRKQVMALLVAVALLLVIACANVSNLLLARASTRSREMAVRTAMGASRRRLIRQLASESLLLGLAGGALGTGLAWLGIPVLLSLIPVDLPRWMSFTPDGRVLVFSLGVSLLTTLVFGLVPAFGSSAVDLTAALRDGGRVASVGLRQQLLRNGLVVSEVALSVILLAAAGLTVRSFLALRAQHLGYDPQHVVSLDIAYPPARYDSGAKAHALIQGLTEEVSSLPGITSVAFASGIPLYDGWTRIYTIEGRPRDLKDMPTANHVVVTPAYFRTLKIPLLIGRGFTEADFDQQGVVIVTKAFERENWPGGSAIGQRVRFGPPDDAAPWRTVVGVVGDDRHEHLKTGGRPTAYLPYSADAPHNVLLARTSGDPAQIVPAIRSRLVGFDRDIAVVHVFTLPQLIERDSWQDRFLAVMFMAFATLALALAAVGLYAVVSYTVSMHTREIGIRMALGGTAASVVQMLMRQALALAGTGLAIGLVGALALTRLLRSQLFGVSPLDPTTYAVMPLLLMSVAALAAFVPAHRAARVDPMIALRRD